jgi:hypothetical protein
MSAVTSGQAATEAPHPGRGARTRPLKRQDSQFFKLNRTQRCKPLSFSRLRPPTSFNLNPLPIVEGRGVLTGPSRKTESMMKQEIKKVRKPGAIRPQRRLTLLHLFAPVCTSLHQIAPICGRIFFEDLPHPNRIYQT